MNENKDNINNVEEEFKPLIEKYTKILLEKLIQKKIIKEIKTTSKDNIEYVLVDEQSQEDITENITINANTYIKQIIDIKELIFKVSDILNISLDKFIDELTLFSSNDQLQYLSDIAGFTKLIIEKIDQINEEIFDKKLLNIFENNKSNFNKYYNEIIEFYTFHIAKNCFNNHSFNRGLINFSKSIDITGSISNIDFPDILIDVKIRKRNIRNLNDIILQCVESLITHNKVSKKNNILIFIIFSNIYFDKDAIYEQLNNNIENSKDLFKNLFILPVSLKKLEHLNDDFKEINQKINNNYFIKPIAFQNSPKLININEVEFVNSEFLKYDEGSISTWVKVPTLSELLKNTRNNRYIFGHDTNNGIPISGKHYNAFGLCLHPIPYNQPGKVNWRIWLSNDLGEQYYIECPSWLEDESNWHLFIIRWDHKKQLLNFYIDNKLIIEKRDYLSNWPKEFSSRVFIGNWVNLNHIHHLNMPIFRIIISDKFLNNEWISNEYYNKSINY